MANHDIWIRPPSSSTAGGYVQVTYGKYDSPTLDYVNDSNTNYFCGYNCDSTSYYPCRAFKSFTKFDITDVNNFTLAEATLYLYFAAGGSQGNRDNPSVDILYRDPDTIFGSYDEDDYPWDTLDAYDWGCNGYTNIDELTHIDTGTPSWIDGIADGNYGWYELDVTAAVSGVFSEGWDWFAIAIISERNTPTYPDWDYNNPQFPEQELWATCYGAGTSYYKGSIPSYPASKIRACPWLKITITTDDPPIQPQPGIFGAPQNVWSVAADARSLTALAGVGTGNLWITYDGGFNWDLQYHFNSGITAIYMDTIKNYNDYPNTATAWVGLYNGAVYKSIDSFKTWSLVSTCSDAIVEIRGSELNSDKVVVGAGNSLYITSSGGDGWIQKSYSDVGVG